jgi:hypothetical protein
MRMSFFDHMGSTALITGLARIHTGHYFYSILRTSGMAHFQASFPSLIPVLLQLEKQFYLHTPAGASAAPQISV